MFTAFFFSFFFYDGKKKYSCIKAEVFDTVDDIIEVFLFFHKRTFIFLRMAEVGLFLFESYATSSAINRVRIPRFS